MIARYASLYFVACVDKEDNELITLEVIHHFVEVLDRYFGNVSAATPAPTLASQALHTHRRRALPTTAR